MGKTAFSGPVYGAKSMLWGFSQTLASSGASTFCIAKTAIPPYEDWYITEFAVSASSNGATAWYLKSEGGSSGLVRYQGQASTVAQTIASVVSGASSVVNTFATVTASAGEYEGMYVPAGSTIRLVSSGAVQAANLCVSARGFVRFINSTRSEG